MEHSAECQCSLNYDGISLQGFTGFPHMLLNRSAIQRRRVQAMRDCAVGVIHSWISLKYPNTVTPVCLNWKYWCTDSLLTDESDKWADTGTLSITNYWLIKGNQKWQARRARAMSMIIKTELDLVHPVHYHILLFTKVNNGSRLFYHAWVLYYWIKYYF